MKMITPQTRQGARRLMTVQIFAGLALLALAVPYSGCLTSYMWNNETVLIASRREGRVEFKGDLADRLVNAEGDTAYPGTMDFCSEERGSYKQTGWLVVPSAYHCDWWKRIERFRAAITSARYGDGSAMTVETNPRPTYQIIGFDYRPGPFLQATEFPFHWEGDTSFNLEKSGYKRVSTPVLGNVGDLDEKMQRLVGQESGNITGLEINGPMGGQPTRAHPNGLTLSGTPTTECNTGFNIVFNPLKRTGTTDFFNTMSKVVLTVPTVAGDVATGAVVVGGAVIVGGVTIVSAPFVFVGGAIGKAFEDEPAKKSGEKCAEDPEPAAKSSCETPESESAGK